MFLLCVSFMRSSKKVRTNAGCVRCGWCQARVEEKGRQAARSVTQGFSFISNVDKITTIWRTDVSGKLNSQLLSLLSVTIEFPCEVPPSSPVKRKNNRAYFLYSNNMVGVVGRRPSSVTIEFPRAVPSLVWAWPNENPIKKQWFLTLTSR